MQQIIFKFDTQFGTFCDALYLPKDHTFTEEQIEAMKQNRLDNWLLAIANPIIETPVEE